MMAMAEEPEETWARRRKRNPKRLGEIAEAAFLLRAADLGLGVAKPWETASVLILLCGRDGEGGCGGCR